MSDTSAPRVPSMEFETRTEQWLTRLLPRVDPAREGACIEIGVGTYHWYCDLFARLGFRAVAVEPLPAAPFLERLPGSDITFYEGVVSEYDGTATVYLGKGDDTNLSSLRRDWWAATSATRVVPSMTLGALVREADITRLTCLKVDAEGTEERILRQLQVMPPPLLPAVVVFEFGAAVFTEGLWLPHFDSDTMSCLRILQACGYGLTLTIDVFSEERQGDLRHTLDPLVYFGPDSQAGNVIAERSAAG